MVVEMAKSNGKFIGFRITVGAFKYLVWRDQQNMEGIRSGESFVPGIGETIEYEIVYASVL